MPGRPRSRREQELERQRALSAAAEFIRRSFHRRPTLAEIAEAAHLSPFHLHRLFKRQFGESPFQMVARLQIERAKELLLQGVPSGEIAGRVGFAHHSHFVTRFKQATGSTPARWQRDKMRK